MKLPAAPQPFWLEGPLEPPVGGHFTLLHAPESLQPNIYFPEKRYHSRRSQSSLEARTASTKRRSGTATWPVGAGKEKRKSIHGPNIIIDFTIAQYAIEVVIYIDEPALVAEPGWLQVQQLAP